MVDVLSQSEIDALLAALSSGEMDAEELKREESQRKIRTYDFKRAVRFSKDHLRSLTRNTPSSVTRHLFEPMPTPVEPVVDDADAQELPLLAATEKKIQDNEHSA